MKISEWRERGLVSEPKTEKQLRAALDARNYIETRTSFTDIRQLIWGGRKPSEVWNLLWIRNETGGLTCGTSRKYTQLYRRFFCLPIDFLRAANPNSVSAAAEKKIALIPVLRAEIEKLTEVADLQWERVKRLNEFEKSLGGLPMPDLHREVVALKDVLNTIIERKMDLGVDGYVRRPKQMSFAAHIQPAPPFNVTEQEKRELLSFGEFLTEAIELTRHPGQDGKPQSMDFLIGSNGKTKLN